MNSGIKRLHIFAFGKRKIDLALRYVYLFISGLTIALKLSLHGFRIQKRFLMNANLERVIK